MFSPFVRAISLEFLYIKGEYLVSYTLKSTYLKFYLIYFLYLFDLLTQSNNHDDDVLKKIIIIQ